MLPVSLIETLTDVIIIERKATALFGTVQDAGEREGASKGMGALTEPETQCLWEEELHSFAAAPRVSPRLSPLSSKVVKAKKSKKDPVNFDVKMEFDMMNSPLDQFMGFNSGLVKTEDFY